VYITISSSARNNIVGIGGAVSLPVSVSSGGQVDIFSTTFSIRLKQNLYTAELIAIEEAIKLLLEVFNY